MTTESEIEDDENQWTMAGKVRHRESILSHPISLTDEISDIEDIRCLRSSLVHHRPTKKWCDRLGLRWESLQPGSVSNLCSATLGAGALSLPYAISLTGIVIGVLLLIASAYLTIISVDVIIDACVRTELLKYEDVAQRLVGQRAGRLLEASLLIFCFGVSWNSLVL